LFLFVKVRPDKWERFSFFCLHLIDSSNRIEKIILNLSEWN